MSNNLLGRICPSLLRYRVNSSAHIGGRVPPVPPVPPSLHLQWNFDGMVFVILFVSFDMLGACYNYSMRCQLIYGM